MRTWIVAFVALLLALVGCALPGPGAFTPVDGRPSKYPYRSQVFGSFVTESFRNTQVKSPQIFYTWMDGELRRDQSRTWEALVATHRGAIEKAKSVQQRVAAQRAFALDLHRSLKRTMPKFSLERGFEFRNAVRYGERQCLLQSVVIASLLQTGGVDAGTAMVWRNIAGETSNLAHVCALMRLADGNMVMVDASDPTPFVGHMGLFMRDGVARDYRFLVPKFAGDTITGFERKGDGTAVPNGKVQFLDVSYIRSQFDYYRGERAPYGVLAKAPTTSGLQASARYLQAGLKLCPENPLAHYMLGVANRKLGRPTDANLQFDAARGLYERMGWVPPNVVGARG